MPVPLAVRGLMLDAARLVESPAYYKRFIAFAADWGANAVVLRLTDDEGCAVRFRSHPELLTHPNALSPDDVQDLARYARCRKIELIPEIESFGHSKYITSVPEYCEVMDGDVGGKSWRNGVAPLHPRVMKLFEDLYEETCRLVRSRYLHGGCDEVAWGANLHSMELLKTRSREQVWGEYLNGLNSIARRLGREFIVWADHVLRHEPGILDHLDRSVILLDWDYSEVAASAIAEMARRALGKGFRVIGGPALVWCRWGCRPGIGALRNVDAFVEAYRGLEDEKALGIIVTNWLPGRYLQDAIWDCLAYAAKAMTDGAGVARNKSLPEFVRRHWGAEWDDDWADFFHSLYAYVENRASCSPVWMRPAQPVVWCDEAGLRSVLSEGRTLVPPFARLVKVSRRLARRIKKRKDDFKALALTVAYLEHIYWRAAVVCEAHSKGLAGSQTRRLIEEVNRRDRAMLEALVKDWNRGRTPKLWREMRKSFRPEDRLVSRMAEAAAFTTELSLRPSELERIFCSIRGFGQFGNDEKDA